MAKKYYKKFNKMLPKKPKKNRLTTTQKVAWSMMSVVVLAYVVPEVVTQLYNYINRGDSTEIKLPQKGDLFPENEKNDNDKKEQDRIDKDNKNYAEKTPEEELANLLYGDEGCLIQEYSNSNQQDLTKLNDVINRIRNDKSKDDNTNKDLFPDDEYLDAENTFSKG